ncbi:hypothetical protein [Terrabacter sp. Root181]|uniref:hypothetical protein n=1 Tax=Terrabacter sp. Root181 TaxID=1736484 RepID=UPI00138F4D73|nr:hypothetical protein [Terrabacter sp. Root181]
MSMTPTHGDPERWLPDPSWPVPPRGWQLWAAAGSVARAERPDDVGVGHLQDGSEPHAGPRIDHTGDVKSEMPCSAALENASFTLPTRPSAMVDDGRVDLLADRPARRIPEGALAGFAVLGVLVLFSCLVGGLTGGLIVIGVSTLLAASAALVRGHLSLSQVGGQRGAGLLLGAAVTALIVGSVATHDRRPGVEVLPSAPVPVSSEHVTDTSTAYAAVPPSHAAASVTPPVAATTAPGPVRTPAASAPDEPVVPVVDATPAAAPRADTAVAASGSTAGGQALTLSPDALSPAAAPTGVADPTASKSAKGGKSGKSGKDPRTSTTSKDSKGTKTSKGSKTSKASKGSTTSSDPRPALSDAGIGGSGAASTSMTGFSVTPGARADKSGRQGGPTVVELAPASASASATSARP